MCHSLHTEINDSFFEGIGVGDQVFGIGTNDDDDDDILSVDRFSVVYRSGVTSSDLSGKTWKRVTAAIVADSDDIDVGQHRGTRPISISKRSGILEGKYFLVLLPSISSIRTSSLFAIYFSISELFNGSAILLSPTVMSFSC